MDFEDEQRSWRKELELSRTKRVKALFAALTSPYRIQMLRVLNSKGPLSYSDLKTHAGFHSKRESGKFAYHLRDLSQQSLIYVNRTEKRYMITNIGKVVIGLVRQIEQQSLSEEGPIFVRSSYASMDEFDVDVITRSLINEGEVPMTLAQKISEEAEDRIYKYQPDYLTGSIIREMVNNILIENRHTDYHKKLIHLGMSVSAVRRLLSDADLTHGGTEDIFSKISHAVLAEYLFSNILPRDTTVDLHISGDLHISDPGLWSLLPDTLFADVRELIKEGLHFSNGPLTTSQIPPARSLGELATVLPPMLALISREVSREIVLDGLPSMLSEYDDSLDLEKNITRIFSAASTISKHPVLLSFVVPLDSEMADVVISAYRDYVEITPVPHIGLIIRGEEGNISRASDKLAEIILMGGRISFAKRTTSNKGISPNPTREAAPSITLHSISLNLPRKAFESSHDESYFMVILILLIDQIRDSVAQRQNLVSDFTKNGFNSILGKYTQNMQRGSTTLLINLTGLDEAIFGVLGHAKGAEGLGAFKKVIETVVNKTRERKSASQEIKICMTESGAATRFVLLDNKKYGKNAVKKIADPDSYSEGLSISAADARGFTDTTPEIILCNEIHRLLDGNLLVNLKIEDDSEIGAIREAIERMSRLVPAFRPVMRFIICRGCGMRRARRAEKCTRCDSAETIEASNRDNYGP